MVTARVGQLNVEETPLLGSRTVDCFEKLKLIGEGTYGQVYMAKETETGEIVALKKVRMEHENEGFPITALREIKILRRLDHVNVARLKEVVTSQDSQKDDQGRPGNKYAGAIYMVFEYMDHDLAGLSRRLSNRFTIPQIKCYMKQLLTGLNYCHLQQVLHRDIKASNLLINNEGRLKLTDFGLARFYPKNRRADLTNHVITLQYRPPELLLGATKYGPAVDIWSVGCIFAELLNGKPIFTGTGETEQLYKIFEICGAPDEVSWPGVAELPWYEKLKPNRPMKRCFREHFGHFDRYALKLVERMLMLDPAQRISAGEALDFEYFSTEPLPSDPRSLPEYEASHNLGTKNISKQQTQHEEEATHQNLQHSSLQACRNIQQSAPSHPQLRPGPFQPTCDPQQFFTTGTGRYYGIPAGAGHSGGPSRSRSEDPIITRGYHGDAPHWQQGHQHGSSDTRGGSLHAGGLRGYRGGVLNYQQGGPRGRSFASRGSHNQQHGQQQ